jgi:hypothetical protein
MDANIKKLNKDVLLLVDDALEQAVARSGENFRSVISAVTAVHPEMTFSAEEWTELSIKKKLAAIKRIRKTLDSL